MERWRRDGPMKTLTFLPLLAIGAILYVVDICSDTALGVRYLNATKTGDYFHDKYLIGNHNYYGVCTFIFVALPLGLYFLKAFIDWTRERTKEKLLIALIPILYPLSLMVKTAITYYRDETSLLLKHKAEAHVWAMVEVICESFGQAALQTVIIGAVPLLDGLQIFTIFSSIISISLGFTKGLIGLGGENLMRRELPLTFVIFFWLFSSSLSCIVTFGFTLGITIWQLGSWNFLIINDEWVIIILPLWIPISYIIAYLLIFPSMALFSFPGAFRTSRLPKALLDCIDRRSALFVFVSLTFNLLFSCFSFWLCTAWITAMAAFLTESSRATLPGYVWPNAAPLFRFCFLIKDYMTGEILDVPWDMWVGGEMLAEDRCELFQVN